MKILACILLLTLTAPGLAQSDYLHINHALEQSKKENKPIMLVFSGSDWCKPCIQLKKDILDTQIFVDSTEDLIFMYLDFPYKKANLLSDEETQHNEQLAEQYNTAGHFPSIIFINDQGQIIQEVVYEKGMLAESFLIHLRKISKSYANVE